MAKKKKELAMAEVTKGYESFIKGQKANKKGKDLFDSAINKSVKPRSAK